MNGWERMLTEQRDEIKHLRRKVDRLERALTGMFYRVTGAIAFAHLVIGPSPTAPKPPARTHSATNEESRGQDTDGTPRS